ncbi:hypothetical protein Trydic_g22310 [Trypoxylus dichotomus]
MIKQVWFIIFLVELAFAQVDDTQQLIPQTPPQVYAAYYPPVYPGQPPIYGAPIYYTIDGSYVSSFLPSDNIVVDPSLYAISGIPTDPVLVANAFRYLAPYGAYGSYGGICL